MVENFFHLAGFVETQVREMLGSFDELPHHVLLHHDFGVVFDVGRRGDGARELREEGRSANTLQKILFLKARGEREDVYRLMFAEKLEHRLENHLVFLEVEGVGRDKVENFVNRVGAKHDGAQERRFGLKRVRRDAQTCFFV